MSSKVRTVKRQSDWSSPVQAEPERFSGITTKRYYLVKWIAMITMLIDHLAFLLHSDCGLDSTTYIAMRTIGRIAFPLFVLKLWSVYTLQSIDGSICFDYFYLQL